MGPGGFSNLTVNAKNIIFIGSWMQGGNISLKNGELQILKIGSTKLVHKVSEITFNAKQALEKKQNVYYVTDFGTLRLGDNGLELIQINSGLNFEKDILPHCEAKIYLSDDLK